MEHKCVSMYDLLFQILSLVILNRDSFLQSKALELALPGLVERMISYANVG